MSVAEAPRSDPSGRGAAFSGAAGGDHLTVVEPLIFDASRPERRAVRFPAASAAAREAASGQPELPASARRGRAPRLPEVSELDDYALESAMEENPDDTLALLADLTGATDPKLRERVGT